MVGFSRKEKNLAPIVVGTSRKERNLPPIVVGTSRKDQDFLQKSWLALVARKKFSRKSWLALVARSNIFLATSANHQCIWFVNQKDSRGTSKGEASTRQVLDNPCAELTSSYFHIFFPYLTFYRFSYRKKDLT